MTFPKTYADRVQRFRVPGGFVMLASFVLLARPTWESFWMGIPVSAIGLAIRAWAAGHLAKNEELAQSGPYAWVRNPLYAGSLFMAGGVVVSSNSWILGVIFAITFFGIYLPVIQLEEEHLCKIFPSYAAYAGRVPSLIPRLSHAPSTAPFRADLFRRNKEWRAWAGYCFALALMLLRLYV
ncbi:MAG: isoprenylcysteine carboxylmethyltransferase family protein [Acidobacteria bacterium]|nr:isoprenylcysteine carboxylmethyltransferase family protein [Acidobacteriota bacterium]